MAASPIAATPSGFYNIEDNMYATPAITTKTIRTIPTTSPFNNEPRPFAFASPFCSVKFLVSSFYSAVVVYPTAEPNSAKISFEIFYVKSTIALFAYLIYLLYVLPEPLTSKPYSFNYSKSSS